MPRYTFECQDCSVRFERTLKIGDHPTHDCPSCQDPAPRVFDGQGFGFGFSSGGAPANSGVHDHDYPTADKAVGKSAEERWAMIERREEVKKQAREQGGTHALIRRTGKDHLDYEPMTENGRNARRKLAKQVVLPPKKEKQDRK